MLVLSPLLRKGAFRGEMGDEAARGGSNLCVFVGDCLDGVRGDGGAESTSNMVDRSGGGGDGGCFFGDGGSFL